MGYNFPANPTNGQVYGPYTFDGDAWVGGLAVGPQQNPQEQFFDLAGKTSFDITIPSWANAVEIDGVFYAASPGGQTVTALYSADGTTFINTGYTFAGPMHDAGTALYQTQAAAGTTGLWLSTSGDQASLYGHDVQAHITVRRPTATAYFTCRAFSKSYNAAAANLYRTMWLTSLLSGQPANVLQMQKLRLGFSGGAACTAGSFAKVRWIGDPGSIASAVRSDNLGIYSCAVTCNASQSINSAAFNKVDAALNSVVHDPSSMWDNTLKRIVPKREGLYLFEGLVSIESVSDAARMVVGVYKNGVLAALLGRGTAGALGIAGFGGAVLLKANGTTDYFELWAYHNSGSAQLIQGTIAGGYAGYTHFGATYIGNDAPSSAVIADAPSDGNEYVRINGVWRLKKQFFALPKTAVPLVVPVPPWAKHGRFTGHCANVAGSAYSFVMRASVDGTTFQTGAGDYSVALLAGQGSAASWSPSNAYQWGYISFQGQNVSLGHHFTCDINLRMLSGGAPSWRSVSYSYDNAAAILAKVQVVGGYFASTAALAMPIGTALKALQFFPMIANAVGASTDGWLDVEWG